MQPYPETNFVEIGSDVRIYPLARLVRPERITIGSHVIIDDFAFIGGHDRLVIGHHVHIASHASITGGGICILCDFVGIATGVRILSGTDTFHGEGLTGPTIPMEYRSVKRGTVIIGPHVVVGANAVVLPDVTIGEGAIVGAGAVVTKDLGDWGIYTGVPARQIATRESARVLEFEQKLIDQEGLSDKRFRSATDLMRDLH